MQKCINEHKWVSEVKSRTTEYKNTSYITIRFKWQSCLFTSDFHLCFLRVITAARVNNRRASNNFKSSTSSLFTDPVGLHINLSQKSQIRVYLLIKPRGSSERIWLLHWHPESSCLHANSMEAEIVTRREVSGDPPPLPFTQQNIQVMFTQWACFTNPVAQSHTTCFTIKASVYYTQNNMTHVPWWGHDCAKCRAPAETQLTVHLKYIQNKHRLAARSEWTMI